MATEMHPAAPHHLPAFITAPGETDYFYNGSVIFLIVIVIMLGTLYFRLHALPEHLAHGSDNKLQFQLVSVLALLALFTHNNIFWVAALILALVRIPDLATPLESMAEALSKMVGWRRPVVEAEHVASDRDTQSLIVDGGGGDAKRSDSVGPVRPAPADVAALPDSATTGAAGIEAQPPAKVLRAGGGSRASLREVDHD